MDATNYRDGERGTGRVRIRARILTESKKLLRITEIPFGVTVRSQAHETLGAMTTIIMRTSHDNRDRLFLALFQGFLSLGNLSVTLIFHEAPTGTRK